MIWNFNKSVSLPLLEVSMDLGIFSKEFLKKSFITISHEIYGKHWKSLLAEVHCKKDNGNLSDPIHQ